MRILVMFLLLANVHSVNAITKCEFNGKVTYKKGNCPESATTKYLVKDEYIEEEQLQEYRQERIEQSEKAFKKVTMPKKRPVIKEE